MQSSNPTLMRDMALELIQNKIATLESKLKSLRRAERFVKELKIDNMAIEREEAAETLAAIIMGGYFD